MCGLWVHFLFLSGKFQTNYYCNAFNKSSGENHSFSKIEGAGRDLCAWKAPLLTETVAQLLQHLLRRYWTNWSVLVALSCHLTTTLRLDSSSQIGTTPELDGATLASYHGTRKSVSLTGNFRDNCGKESLAVGVWRPPILRRHHHRRSHGGSFVAVRCMRGFVKWPSASDPKSKKTP